MGFFSSIKKYLVPKQPTITIPTATNASFDKTTFKDGKDAKNAITQYAADIPVVIGTAKVKGQVIYQSIPFLIQTIVKNDSTGKFEGLEVYFKRYYVAICAGTVSIKRAWYDGEQVFDRNRDGQNIKVPNIQGIFLDGRPTQKIPDKYRFSQYDIDLQFLINNVMKVFDMTITLDMFGEVYQKGGNLIEKAKDYTTVALQILNIPDGVQNFSPFLDNLDRANDLYQFMAGANLNYTEQDKTSTQDFRKVIERIRERSQELADFLEYLMTINTNLNYDLNLSSRDFAGGHRPGSKSHQYFFKVRDFFKIDFTFANTPPQPKDDYYKFINYPDTALAIIDLHNLGDSSEIKEWFFEVENL